MLFSLLTFAGAEEAFTITDPNGAILEGTSSVYTLTEAGEYTLSGTLSDGQIIVEAAEDAEVKLILKGVSISSTFAAPITILSADEVTIKSEEGTVNTITDLRTGSVDEASETGAIDAVCDLHLTGKGILTVTSSFDKGIKTKDDLSIKNVTLTVTSVGAALKGNDSVKITSGILNLTSLSADCIKTSNSSLSNAGKQKGSIQIEGGTITVNAAQDGLSAAYNVEIKGEDTVLTIYTSSYAGQTQSANTHELYLVVPNSLYDTSLDYYLYCYGDDFDSGVWVACDYDCVVYSGRNAAYVGLLARVPSDATTLIVATVASGTTPDGTNLSASSDAESINQNMNAYLIGSISSSEISGDWVQLSSGSGSNKTTYSSKGIKADNDILISGGVIEIKAMDDAIHANGDDTLENGETSTGDVLISGGTISITSADDGIHADGELMISGGTIQVIDSHEGLEGNVISISGGTIQVYADDDGINASSGRATPLIQISGGSIEVTTPSGDTDGIDSNGSIVMSGGFVLVKGGASMGNMAGSVDVDGTITVTGGTIIALGGICETPVSGSCCTYISNGTSFSSGKYSLQTADGTELSSFTLTDSYSSCWISSEHFTVGESYTLLKDGETVLSWTQSSETEGSAGFGGFGGGFGGGGFGGGRWGH